jgi:hypothetical protein
MEADIDFNDNTGINVKDPVLSGSIANKRYVDNLLNTVVNLEQFLSNPSGVGVLHVSPDGAAVGSKVVFVDLFSGIYADGSADSTAGLKTLVDTYGKTNIEYVFNSAGTYKLHSTDAVYTATPSIVNGVCTNFYLNFNGATIEIDRTFANGSSSFLWQIKDGSRDVRIGRHRVLQDKEWANADMYNAGTWWLYFENAVTNVYIEQAYGENLRLFLDVTRGTDETKRARNIYCEGISTVHVSYPLSLRNNGDDVHVRYLHSREAGRPTIAYGWKGALRIDELIEQDSDTQIKLMNPTSGADLFNNNDGTTGVAIINHIGLAPTGVAGFGEAARMSIEQRGAAPGVFGPLYIKSHVQLEEAGVLTQGFLNISKTDGAGVADSTTGRGHRISVVLDSEIHGCPATQVLALFTTVNGDWAGETVNFVIEKLVTSGSATSSVGIDYDGMTVGPLMKYVNTVGTWTETGTQSGTSTKLIFNKSGGTASTNVPLTNKANIFTQDQEITKANARFNVKNNSGTASTLQFGADSGLVFLGSMTNANVNLYQNSAIVGAITSEGPRSELAMALKDGVTAPSATVGYAKIFVDTADGDLKIIFGDGTTKTIVVDT